MYTPGGTPRFPGTGSPGWPSISLSAATDWGVELLVRKLQVCVDAAYIGSGRVIVVDPIDDAATEFYGAFGFVPTKGPSSRMVMKVSTAAAALEQDRTPSP